MQYFECIFFVIFNQGMFAFSINVSFKRLVMFFTVILVYLGTKEYNGMPHGYHLFHIKM